MRMTREAEASTTASKTSKTVTASNRSLHKLSLGRSARSGSVSKLKAHFEKIRAGAAKTSNTKAEDTVTVQQNAEKGKSDSQEPTRQAERGTEQSAGSKARREVLSSTQTQVAPPLPRSLTAGDLGLKRGQEHNIPRKPVPALRSRTATRLPAPAPAPAAPFNNPTVAAASQRAAQPAVRSPISPRAATPAMGIRSPLGRQPQGFAPIRGVLEEPAPGTPTPQPRRSPRRFVVASEPASRQHTPTIPKTPVLKPTVPTRPISRTPRRHTSVGRDASTSRNASPRRDARSASQATTAVGPPSPPPAALVTTPHGFAWWSGRFAATCDRLATRAHRAALAPGRVSPAPRPDGASRAPADPRASPSHQHHGSAARRVVAAQSAQDPAARAALAFAELRAGCRGHAARESLRAFRAEWYRVEEERDRREGAQERGEEERRRKAEAAAAQEEEGDAEGVRRNSGFLGKVREFSQSRLPKLGGKK